MQAHIPKGVKDSSNLIPPNCCSAISDSVLKLQVNVKPDKAEGFINELANLLNRYGLDGLSICNETIIQINLLDLMEYSVKPIQTRDSIRNALIENIIKERGKNQNEN